MAKFNLAECHNLHINIIYIYTVQVIYIYIYTGVKCIVYDNKGITESCTFQRFGHLPGQALKLLVISQLSTFFCIIIIITSGPSQKSGGDS